MSIQLTEKQYKTIDFVTEMIVYDSFLLKKSIY